MATVCVLLADGFEEIEAVTIIDTLRRADLDVSAIGVTTVEPTGSHGITIRAEHVLDDVREQRWDLVVLPGGMPGAARLRDDPQVQALVRAQHEAGGRIAAICAAPIALSKAGVLDGKRATSYPTFEGELVGARYQTDAVVVDGTITTSRGPATAMSFALELVAQLCGADRAKALAKGMLATP